MSDYTLALDGSTYAGTVALISGHEVIAERSLPRAAIPSRGQRGEDFMPMVEECLVSSGVTPRELARVVCGAGPGSFTSLRVAASIAKGIAVGAGCPLFAVSSLLLIAASADLPPGRYVCVLPAMRGEHFALDVVIDESSGPVSRGDVDLVSTALLESRSADLRGALIGPDVGSRSGPHARGVARLMDAIVAEGPCDVGTWEPDYGRVAEAQARWEAAHGRPLGIEA
jgi:tRNA threonylcarbamoyladenosine biosynthesis protein TsaB